MTRGLTRTEAWYADYLRQRGHGAPSRRVVAPREEPALRSPASPYASKTEARFARDVLAVQQYDGLIRQWWYAPFGLKLAPRLHYYPDFLVWPADSSQYILYEIKGNYIRDRALHKVKMAAAQYPCFAVVLAQWDGAQWGYSTFPST